MRRDDGLQIPEELTPRQREVFVLVVQGRSNEEIAAVLGCAATTVGNHRTAIHRRLRTHNEVELVALAHGGVKPAFEPSLDMLSPVERRVFDLVVRDRLRTEDIARVLRVSPSTVEARRSAIHEKLGTHTPADLVRFAQRAGLGEAA